MVKRDGSRESFDKSKLLRGIIRSCEKTGIPSNEIEEMVEEIETAIMGRSLREITSAQIGELVLIRLRHLSEVAYIRFASVYRQFQGIRDFVDTLNQLQNDPPAQTSDRQSLRMSNLKF